MVKLPSRQVHLDFHTSEHIPGIGARFDRRQWQQALKAGRLNSITVFAKCHHGWSYYRTAVGEPHPQLARPDLLAEQIEAAHAIGVRAPIYYTVGWSAHDATRHPDWVVRRKDGTLHTNCGDPAATAETPRPGFSWHYLCPSGDYLDLMLRQTREICETLDVDGLFYDITNGPACWCAACRRDMQAVGLNPERDEDAAAWNVCKWQRFMDGCNAIIRRTHPDATIFFNGTMNIHQPWMHGYHTHFELEDLPTTWGGYDKFPLRARFFANYGRDYLAMSGKFHTAWGEFGGFKHRDAIRFEAACMIAYGSRCSFGDQLHPNGAMDMATYRNIGHAYRYVEQVEPYGLDGVPASRLGVWLSGAGSEDDQGVANMLMEAQFDFRVVDPDRSLDDFDAIILTGNVRLDAAGAARLHAFAASGRGLLVLNRSGLDASGKRFLLRAGVRYLGPGRFDVDYTEAGRGPLARDLVDAPFLNYAAAVRVRPLTGATVLAHIREPYFSRTYGRYCSHQNTPYVEKQAPHPAAVQAGSVIYLSHALGDLYSRHGSRLHRQLFLNALNRIYKRPNCTTTLPSAGRMTFLHQPQHRRYVVHLMYGPPLQRGRCMVIEDLLPVSDVPVSIRVPEAIRAVTLVPQGTPLPVTTDRRGCHVVVPRLQGHQALVFSYAV